MAARKLLRSISSLSIKSPSPSCLCSSSSLTRLRPISAFSSGSPDRHFSSHEPPSSPSASSGFDSTKKRPNLRLPGCDYQHWFVVVDKPMVVGATSEEIRHKMIDDYICTLAKVVGSKEVAREKIYSVSITVETCYSAFGALLSEELAYKLRDVPHVRFVLPDSYIDAEKQDYGGTPFVKGKAAPDDAKYDELREERQWERKKQYHHYLKQQEQQRSLPIQFVKKNSRNQKDN